MSWLPEDWQHPTRHDLLTGHHLRPIRADDVDVDYAAVMGSRERLWAMYGEAVPGWLAQRWPFGTVRYPGRELTWQEGQALPDHPAHAAQPPGETSPAS